jgi:hypothetical protein
MQCMILKALGYSYDEIAARTGFSWTKVNRSLTEGRRRFFERFGEIAAGTACRRYQPLLSVACDGHAGADDERLLKAHLASCAGCRAALREYRAAPFRLAELLPPAFVLPLLDRASLWSRINDWLAVTAGERAAAIGAKLHHGAEMVSAQKAAAVVASTAAVAGGGAAVQHSAPVQHDEANRTEQAAGVSPVHQEAPFAEPREAPTPSEDPRASLPESRDGPEPKPEPEPASEFGFESSGGPAAPTARSPEPEVAAASATPRGQEFSPPAASGTETAGGGGEFGP